MNLATSPGGHGSRLSETAIVAQGGRGRGWPVDAVEPGPGTRNRGRVGRLVGYPGRGAVREPGSWKVRD